MVIRSAILIYILSAFNTISATNYRSDISIYKGSHIIKDEAAPKESYSNNILFECNPSFLTGLISPTTGLGIQRKGRITGAKCVSNQSSYEGACWVSDAGISDGKQFINLCVSQNTAFETYEKCVTLGPNERQTLSPDLSLDAKIIGAAFTENFSYTKTGYSGNFSTIFDNNCQNCSGYSYAHLSSNQECDEYIKKSIPNNCQELESKCECIDQEMQGYDEYIKNLPPQNASNKKYICKKNSFIPDFSQSTWKSLDSSTKRCFTCHSKRRMALKKCYLSVKNQKSSIKNSIQKMKTFNSEKQNYGPGNYTCGYISSDSNSALSSSINFVFNLTSSVINQITGSSNQEEESASEEFDINQFAKKMGNQVSSKDAIKTKSSFRCGCIKSDSPIGFYPFPMYVKKQTQTSSFKDIKIKNLGAELFEIYPTHRKFRDEDINQPSNTCLKMLPKETGDSSRGTFFQPKMIIKYGDEEKILTFGIGSTDPYAKIDTQFNNSAPDKWYVTDFDDIKTIEYKEYVKTSDSSCELRKDNLKTPYQIGIRAEMNSETGNTIIAAYLILDEKLGLNFSNGYTYDSKDQISYQKATIYSVSGINLGKKFIQKIGTTERPPIKYTYNNSLLSPISISLKDDSSSSTTKYNIFISDSILSYIPLKTCETELFTSDGLLALIKDNGSSPYSEKPCCSSHGRKFCISRNNCNLLSSTAIINECKSASTTGTSIIDKYCKIINNLKKTCQSNIFCKKDDANCLATNNLSDTGISLDQPKEFYNTNISWSNEVCITSGIDFADEHFGTQTSTGYQYSNTQKYGLFGNRSFDFVIGLKDTSNAKITNSKRPITFVNPESVNNSLIMPVPEFYFAATQTGSNPISKALASYLVSTKSLYGDKSIADIYFPDCKESTDCIKDQIIIRKKEVQEYYPNQFCTDGSEIEDGWSITQPLFNDVYIPYRCHQLEVTAIGAGGSGTILLTDKSTDDSQYVKEACRDGLGEIAQIGRNKYVYTNFDCKKTARSHVTCADYGKLKHTATGSAGGYSSATLDLKDFNSNYLNLFIGEPAIKQSTKDYTCSNNVSGAGTCRTKIIEAITAPFKQMFSGPEEIEENPTPPEPIKKPNPKYKPGSLLQDEKDEFMKNPAYKPGSSIPSEQNEYLYLEPGDEGKSSSQKKEESSFLLKLAMVACIKPIMQDTALSSASAQIELQSFVSTTSGTTSAKIVANKYENLNNLTPPVISSKVTSDINSQNILGVSSVGYNNQTLIHAEPGHNNMSLIESNKNPISGKIRLEWTKIGNEPNTKSISDCIVDTVTGGVKTILGKFVAKLADKIITSMVDAALSPLYSQARDSGVDLQRIVVDDGYACNVTVDIDGGDVAGGEGQLLTSSPILINGITVKGQSAKKLSCFVSDNKDTKECLLQEFNSLKSPYAGYDPENVPSKLINTLSKNTLFPNEQTNQYRTSLYGSGSNIKPIPMSTQNMDTIFKQKSSILNGLKSIQNTSYGSGGSVYYQDDSRFFSSGGPGKVVIKNTKILKLPEKIHKTYDPIYGENDIDCKPKCPRIFVKQLINIVNEGEQEAVCEYSGTEKDDNEGVVGTPYRPNKCYLKNGSVVLAADGSGLGCLITDCDTMYSEDNRLYGLCYDKFEGVNKIFTREIRVQGGSSNNAKLNINKCVNINNAKTSSDLDSGKTFLTLICDKNGFWKFPRLETQSYKDNIAEYKTTIQNKLSFTEDNFVSNWLSIIKNKLTTSYSLSNQKISNQTDIDADTQGTITRSSFKFMCPAMKNLDQNPIMTGNANWNEEYEMRQSYGSCKTDKDDDNKNIYIPSAYSNPSRKCKENGIWGKVYNPCGKRCPTTQINDLGIKWNSPNITSYSNLQSEVIGQCISSYSGDTNPKILKRTCNIETGDWDYYGYKGCNACPIINKKLTIIDLNGLSSNSMLSIDVFKRSNPSQYVLNGPVETVINNQYATIRIYSQFSYNKNDAEINVFPSNILSEGVSWWASSFGNIISKSIDNTSALEISIPISNCGGSCLCDNATYKNIYQTSPYLASKYDFSPGCTNTTGLSSGEFALIPTTQSNIDQSIKFSIYNKSTGKSSEISYNDVVSRYKENANPLNCNSELLGYIANNTIKNGVISTSSQELYGVSQFCLNGVIEKYSYIKIKTPPSSLTNPSTSCDISTNKYLNELFRLSRTTLSIYDNSQGRNITAQDYPKRTWFKQINDTVIESYINQLNKSDPYCNQSSCISQRDTENQNTCGKSTQTQPWEARGCGY